MPTDLSLVAEELLPQKGSMCLLEKVISADDEGLVATAIFRSNSLFCREGRVGAWVSLECMAQAVAAWAGYHDRQQGKSPRMGFLLGSSRFDCARPWLALDRMLRIEVRKEIQMDDGLGQFTGVTVDEEGMVSSAVLTVFSPEDPLAVIQGGARG